MYEDGYCIACHAASEQVICDLCWKLGYRMCSGCATVYDLGVDAPAGDFVCPICASPLPEPDARMLAAVQRRLEGA